MKKEKNRVYIFDTTLRDGEQSPGSSMNTEEKLILARQLEKLGVDIIEAGFPIASDGDFDAVRQIAREIKKSQVAGLARANKVDINRAWQAIKHAAYPRIHTFISSSDIHLKYQLKKSREQVLKEAVAAVRLARSYTENVEFSPMDATRSDKDYLVEMVSAVIDAGACTVNIPDTVGYAIPEEFGSLIAYLFANVKNMGDTIISAHCHDDLGLAVANSLAAIRNGARQVECTINGIGERAGNAAMEEVVMSLVTRKDIFHCYTGINTKQIYTSAKLLTKITGIHVQPNKAIVGANAFAHESGIHQDGVLKHRETYEIMRAEDVGWNANKLTLGKLSGRNALRQRFTALNIEFPSEEAFNAAFQRFKELADRKNEIFDEDLQALVSDEAVAQVSEHYRLVAMGAHSETGVLPVARVVMSMDGVERQDDAQGGGPVDATFKAIEQIVNSGTELQLYSVNNITSGTDAQGEVTVRLSKGGRIVNGQGADTDIVVASAKAYLNALNKLHSKLERAHPQV